MSLGDATRGVAVDATGLLATTGDDADAGDFDLGDGLRPPPDPIIITNSARKSTTFRRPAGFLHVMLLPPLLLVLLLSDVGGPVSADQDAKRLYEDLLTDYNRLIRPVGNNSDRLTVKLGLKLSQLIDVVRYFKINVIEP